MAATNERFTGDATEVSCPDLPRRLARIYLRVLAMAAQDDAECGKQAQPAALPLDAASATQTDQVHQVVDGGEEDANQG